MNENNTEKKYEIWVDDIFKNNKSISFRWSAKNIGYGELVIDAVTHDIIDSECMSKNFCDQVMKIGFEKLENTEKINAEISDLKKSSSIEAKYISDTYHTFDELYTHRLALSVALTKAISLLGREDVYAYKSLKHYDDTMFDGMFVVVIESPLGQISYHYELEYWSCFDLMALDKAYEYDGHTSDDVISRLIRLL